MAEHFYYSIASGSSGNCGLYVSDGTAVLIDVGVSLRKLTAALAAFDMKPGELDALIITHEHIDHVKGLAMFLKGDAELILPFCRKYGRSAHFGLGAFLDDPLVYLSGCEIKHEEILAVCPDEFAKNFISIV